MKKLKSSCTFYYTINLKVRKSIKKTLLKPTLNMWFINIIVIKSKNILNIEINNILKFNMSRPT
jgi:hypothetical protein